MKPPSTYCKINEYDPDVMYRLSAKEINIGNYKIGGEDRVIEYLEHLAKVYSKEDERKKIFQDMMCDLLGYEMQPLSVTEAKNELGMRGGDPHRQACGSYGKYIPIVSDCEKYLNPYFLLHLAGLWLGISSAVFRKEIIIESLTSMIPLVPILCCQDHLINILVIFDALKVGLAELKTYYDSVQPDQLNIE
ncbi:4042_t:CDS:2 [Funneliformis caledonium]|uniref:4042_t:CDS:1 n=1 Tax=Funneliformis caledonium TaxID=1117310 RepID=A0A9N9GKW4_9GLOM|nr:4042_t:CDS:2 [Funneliformis caledonium]